MPGYGDRATWQADPLIPAIGWQRTQAPDSPAAGAAYTRKVGGQNYERHLAVSFTYTASAVVANRYPWVSLRDATGEGLATVSVPAAIAAGTVVHVRLAVSMPWAPVQVSTRVFGGLPDLPLQPGSELMISADAMDAGDTITAIRLVLQQVPTSID